MERDEERFDLDDEFTAGAADEDYDRFIDRVDRRKQVWSDGTCSGRFRSRRTSDTGLAWRLVGASGETLVDLWPDRQRSYRPRASPMHLEFNEATELPLRMIAVAATQPLVTNISRICVA